ncbi:MAG TPA: hypothetical protein VLG76_00610 [Rhabdochlamydiaceae bacterium]|nr:hypothetical protein [Rhabdochlamydiaceae bacterium]
MTKFFLLFLIATSSFLFSGTVRLYNDSPYTLRVIVRGNDGSYLGELVMPAQNFSTWSDQQTRAGVFGKGNPYSMGPSMSQLPYTVMWYCMDGGDFSICNNVFTGSTVTAQTCLGTRICKPVPKQTPTNPNQGGQGEGLYTPPPPPTEQQVEEYPPP